MLLKSSHSDSQHRGDLTFIHVGKCGGTTLHKAVTKSPVISSQFRSVNYVHLREEPYKSHAYYLFVVRNPIMRCLSAFNFRFQKVVVSREEEHVNPGELASLKKYGSFSDLAEKLYLPSGSCNEPVVSDWQSISHLKEGFNFYLSPLLKHLKREQIFAVMTQENLNSDMSRILNVQKVNDVNRLSHKLDPKLLTLSNLALKNLTRFLHHEFLSLETLFEIAGTKRESDCPVISRNITVKSLKPHSPVTYPSKSEPDL